MESHMLFVQVKGVARVMDGFMVLTLFGPSKKIVTARVKGIFDMAFPGKEIVLYENEQDWTVAACKALDGRLLDVDPKEPDKVSYRGAGQTLHPERLKSIYGIKEEL